MTEVPGSIPDPPPIASGDDAESAEAAASGALPGEVPPRTEAKSSSRDKEPPPRASVIDAVADLLQFIVDWLRQEAGAIMHDKVVLPAQKLGLTLASGCAAASLAALGIGFIAVGIFILLGQWLTYPGALLLIGGVLVLGAVIFTVIKMRSIQK